MTNNDVLTEVSLNGLTFRDLQALRGEFIEAASDLFDKLVSGERSAARDLWIDSDPFHDRPPRRIVQITAQLEVRQEQRNG